MCVCWMCVSVCPRGPISGIGVSACLKWHGSLKDIHKCQLSLRVCAYLHMEPAYEGHSHADTHGVGPLEGEASSVE